MEWSNEDCLALIDLYEQNSVLWDTKHGFHYSKSKKTSAWAEIANNFDTDITTVKKKMDSLLGSFRAQKSKGRKSVKTANGLRKDIYLSKWFAFDRMKFLLDKDRNDETNDWDLLSETDALSPEDPTNSTDSDLITGNEERNSVEETEIFIKTEETLPTEIEAISMKPPQPKYKRPKKHQSHEDPRIVELFTILRDTHDRYSTTPVQIASTVDRFATYGQHVANKLRTYSKRTEAMVEHAINNILFEADMGKYDAMHEYNSPVISPTQSFDSSHSALAPSHFLNQCTTSPVQNVNTNGVT